jgi:hypothetical protein
MLGTQYSGKMVGQTKSENRLLKILLLPQQGIPPTGLGSLGGVRRGTARTRVVFFVKTFQKMVGNVLHEGPGMGQNGVAPWSTMYPQPGNSV